MRKRLFIAAATIALNACAIRNTRGVAVVLQATCGPEKVNNGCFEGGHFTPNPSGIMPLGQGASDLSDWTIPKAGLPADSSLLWIDNKNGVGVSTPFDNRFIDLIESLSAGKVLLPIQQQIQLEPGQYLLHFAVGWDPRRNPEGIVQVNWALAPAGSAVTIANNTATTTGTSMNHWEQFNYRVSTAGGPMVLSFETPPSPPVAGLPVQVIGLDNISMVRLFTRACLSKNPPPILSRTPWGQSRQFGPESYAVSKSSA